MPRNCCCFFFVLCECSSLFSEQFYHFAQYTILSNIIDAFSVMLILDSPPIQNSLRKTSNSFCFMISLSVIELWCDPTTSENSRWWKLNQTDPIIYLYSLHRMNTLRSIVQFSTVEVLTGRWIATAIWIFISIGWFGEHLRIAINANMMGWAAMLCQQVHSIEYSTPFDREANTISLKHIEMRGPK